MKILLPVLCWLLIALPAARAEELLVFNTVELVIWADCIVTVRPLESGFKNYGYKNGWAIRGLVTEILSDAGVLKPGDTISMYCANSDLSKLDRQDSTSRLMLFLQINHEENDPSGKPGFYLVSSGVRLWQQGGWYRQYQTDTPGPYRLFGPSHFQDYEGYLNLVRQHIAHVDTLRRIRMMTWADERNAALFAWVEQHRDLFLAPPDTCPDGECDQLGSLRYDIFNWIITSAIAPHAWQAIQLFHTLMPQAQYVPTGEPYFGNTSLDYLPFAEAGGIPWLLHVLNDPTRDSFEYGQAAWHLQRVLQEEPARFSMLTIGSADTFLTEILPMLQPDHPLRQGAFWVIAGLGDVYEGTLDSLKKAKVYPAVMRLYRAEPPGPMRNLLIEYLAANLSAETWHDLSGNDAQILIRVETVSFDNLKRVLKFKFLYPRITAHLYTEPELVLLPLDDPPGKQQVLNLAISVRTAHYCPPVDTYFQYVELTLPALPAGRWQYWLRGRAGEKEEFYWQTEPVLLELR